MKTKISALLLLASLASFAAHHAAAATIPAGTDLIVKTAETVGLTDQPGTKFRVRLVKPVAAEGHVILPAGTQFTGTVVTSRRLMASDGRLTVDLTEVIINGRAVPVKTVGPVSLENYTSSRGVSVSRGAYNVATGRTLHFRIARPIKV